MCLFAVAGPETAEGKHRKATRASCQLLYRKPSPLPSCRYQILDSRKDGTKFTNRALREAAEQQSDVTNQYEQLQKDLVAQVSCTSTAVLGYHTHILYVSTPKLRLSCCSIYVHSCALALSACQKD